MKQELKKNTELLRRTALFTGILASLLVLVAVTLILLVVVRLQRKLNTTTPAYTASELYQKAVEQTGKGEYTQAEVYLEQALLKQDDASYRNQLAVVKYRLKKYEQSIEQYTKLIDEGRDAAFAWNGTGNAYRDWAVTEPARAEELQGKAIEAYQKAYSLNAGYVAAYSNLALLYESTGNRERAVETLQQGIEATNSTELKTVLTTISTP